MKLEDDGAVVDHAAALRLVHARLAHRRKRAAYNAAHTNPEAWNELVRHWSAMRRQGFERAARMRAACFYLMNFEGCANDNFETNWLSKTGS
eukprot:2817103-Pleurochrysis_carterae.AAC.2